MRPCKAVSLWNKKYNPCLCVCVRRLVLLYCMSVLASHLSAEPAAILLPSVDQEHLSKFWMTGKDVTNCIYSKAFHALAAVRWKMSSSFTNETEVNSRCKHWQQDCCRYVQNITLSSAAYRLWHCELKILSFFIAAYEFLTMGLVSACYLFKVVNIALENLHTSLLGRKRSNIPDTHCTDT